MRRFSLISIACVVALWLWAIGSAPAGAAALHSYVGSMHEHSAYSDGWPGTRPRDYYESGASYGLDFMGGSDHSDNMGIPAVFSEACYGQGRGGDEVLLPECALADQTNPADSFRKWDATAEQATDAMTAHPGFSAFRGFEWSSDRFGHISVYFSTNWTSAYADGGFGAMSTFWSWFTRAPALDGGSDGIATFNHPGAKKVDITSDVSAPGFNWDDFEYVPAADERMVGVEVFNDKNEYGSVGGPYPEGSYAHALDKGWHVGAVGAEDLGHRKPPLDNWGGPEWAKTVVLAPANSPSELKAALLARHFYAIAPGENALRLSFTVDGAQMGSRLERPVGRAMRFRARVNDRDVSLQLVTSGGTVVASGGRSLSLLRAASPHEGWYFVRARRDGGKIVAYSSPVWVSASEGGPRGQWLAGDLHVHTCYSHDAYCGPTDDNTGPDTFYSSGGTIAERFEEAALKGLSFLAITDHDDLRSQSDPDFGSAGVTGVPAYETSLAGGHAQMLGATRSFDKGDGSVGATAAMAAALRRSGGVFQINHPSYRGEAVFDSCAQADAAAWQTDPLHWKYGFSVVPDAVEVWNSTTLIPPSELYWECWLQRGLRVGLTGGSDSHGASTANLGMPTTWVLASENRPAAVLAAVRAGRTSVSRLPPSLGGARLVLEADADGDGSYESVVGDSVPGGVPMRVRAEGLGVSGLVRVRANGASLVDGARLDPGGSVSFKAPAGHGWVYAVLYLEDGTSAVDPSCGPTGQSIDTCSADLAVAGMTSPIWIGADDRTPAPDGSPRELVPGPGGTGSSDAGEPDSQEPLPAAQQSSDGATPPRVPAVRAVGAAVRSVSLARIGRRLVLARWSSRGARFRVQRRLGGGGPWRTMRKALAAHRLRFRVGRGGLWAVRVRTVPHGATPGPWRVARIRVR